MTPVIPSSTSNLSLIQGSNFSTRKDKSFTRCCTLRKPTKRTLCAQDFMLPLSASVRLFPHIRTYNLHRKPRFGILSATGIDVAVEQPDTPVEEKDSAESLEIPSAEKSNEESSIQSKRSRPSRKSEMPPVKNEDLAPGATFTGKVRSIQPFGAFIDFGAFTDGLVHVSRLSDSYVKDVGTIVSVGQVVKVRLVEANTETGRISLTMRESDDTSRLKDGPTDGDKTRPPRRNTQKSNQRRDEVKKTSKFVKGQDLEGTVKNLTRSGAFISLPEGEEGFLPQSEEADEGFGNIMGGTSLEAGQEVKVRVLRITRGQVTLTMKKEEDVGALNSKLQGIVYTATNPFLVAFRKNKDIAAFLDEREKEEEVLAVVDEKVEQDEVSQPEVDKEPENVVSDSLESVDSALQSIEDEIQEVMEVKSNGEYDVTIVDEVEMPTPSSETENSSSPPVEEEKVEAQIQTPGEESEMSSSTPVADENNSITSEEQVQIPVEESEVSSLAPVEDEKIEYSPDDNGDITSSSEETDVSVSEESTSEETQVGEIVESQNVEATAEQNGSITDLNGQSSDPSPAESTTKATISLALVKQLREETGAGMMDCKKALSETEGDIIKAQEFLRKKGLASADKKASRATAQGRIGSYVHDSRIGVLIEVNCETDFASRGDIFKELVNDLAMQVAACPQVEHLDVPKETVEKEKEIEMQKEDLASKPEQIRSKIVEGRIRKRLEELALLEQPYIKNDKVVVKDFVKQTIATIGENIKVKRFVRFNLGEGLEKKSQDFAAEVAAQTSVKPVAAPKEEQPAPLETKETDEKPAAKVTISAALVKQLREETGAGMMDCKKALSETGGDLQKAQEYLRKKGLLTADKKSSRLAAEGRIGSYIHDSRIGVLIEVNCETDFVGRSEKFKGLVDDLAMQVVACPKVEYVSIEDIPEGIVRKEKEIEMQREDILSKPENIRERIVDGRVSKRLGELALLEQPFLKEDTILVKELVKHTVAAIGENIKVRRFVRFTLGEEIDAKTESET